MQRQHFKPTCPLKRTWAKCCDMCLLAGVHDKNSHCSQSENAASSLDKQKHVKHPGNTRHRVCCNPLKWWIPQELQKQERKDEIEKWKTSRGLPSQSECRSFTRLNIKCSAVIPSPLLWTRQAYASTAHSWLSLNRRLGSKRLASGPRAWRWDHTSRTLS